MLHGLTRARLFVIDDLADRQHVAQALLDQNFFGEATEDRYLELVPSECKLILGPSFALLGPEYSQLRGLMPSRKELNRLLIYFGGVDPENLTHKALEALMIDDSFENIAVDVVLGLNSPYRQMVEKMISFRSQTNIYTSLPSLAMLIARADLSIGAGGSTTWERACLGLPSLTIVCGENQLDFSESLNKANEITLIGLSHSVTPLSIYASLVEVRNRKWPIPSGYDLCDGMGAKRVSDFLLQGR